MLYNEEFNSSKLQKRARENLYKILSDFAQFLR